MAKKRMDEPIFTGDNEHPVNSESGPPPSLEPAEMVPVERAAATAKANGTPAPARKRKRNSTERTYWICGREHAAAPLEHIMPKPTIGQARKALDSVRQMPRYGKMRLEIYRCVRVV